MTQKLDEDALHALKVAFSYMPKAIEVTRYEYAERTDKVLQEIEMVRGVLLDNEVDPDEVYDEINPEHAPNSSY